MKLSSTFHIYFPYLNPFLYNVAKLKQAISEFKAIDRWHDNEKAVAAMPERSSCSAPSTQGRKKVKGAAKLASPGFMLSTSFSSSFNLSSTFVRAAFRAISSSARTLAAAAPPFFNAILSSLDRSFFRIDNLFAFSLLFPIIRSFNFNFLLSFSTSIFSETDFSFPYPVNKAALISAVFIAAISFTPSPHINTFISQYFFKQLITFCFVSGDDLDMTDIWFRLRMKYRQPI
mmetsp:Transcript_13711/g.20816  ORF Transcript_13711/g.20816 Transcript_13711/m.20816 type:complete len:231 (-) Transcript_13711:156-848(-)